MLPALLEFGPGNVDVICNSVRHHLGKDPVPPSARARTGGVSVQVGGHYLMKAEPVPIQPYPAGKQPQSAWPGAELGDTLPGDDPPGMQGTQLNAANARSCSAPTGSAMSKSMNPASPPRTTRRCMEPRRCAR